MATLKR